uniref:ANK_REP_REGION domain-containing protein n=1 Tax=Wuchereria bancrofti TaxID=6293 RepID=A0A1I8EKZ0_WUCBA
MRSNEQTNEKEDKVEEFTKTTKKDEKKKGDSKDKKDKEKRRDSVTGSTLDTSSSSSSSVDSDEVDMAERNNSRSTMTSEESKLQVDSRKVDNSVSQVMKRISMISNMGFDEASKSVMELNNGRKNMQILDADNGIDERNGPDISAKKSRKRNRKQGKEDKRDMPSDQNEMFSNERNLLCTVNEGTKSGTVEVLNDSVMGTCPKLGAWMVRKDMSIDGMETSNLLYMADTSNRFAQRFTHWIRKFYNAAVDGNVEEFMIMFNCILQILKRNAGCDYYKRMSGHHLKEHVMNNVICAFFDKSENTSILHLLSPTKNTDRPCSMRNHGYCRLIKIILSMLPWKSRRILLATSTKRTGKTALHLAAGTGQPCQMQALMDFGAWPDFFDHSGRAPIHYAIMRNNLEMVKLLLWYGADISLRERSATPLQLAGCSPTTTSICEYLHARVNALEKIFMQWVRKYVRGVWTPVHAISDLHFARLSKACDSGRDASRNFTTKNRKIHINISKTRNANPQLKKCPLMLLFIVPTFYKGEDRIADASNPQIFCAKMQNVNGFVVKLLPSRPLLSCSKWSIGIKSALAKPHNGYFYVYKLPENIEVDSYTLHLMVELEELRFQAPHITLAVQAFACGPPDLDHYNELRGFVTHSNNKTKMD